MLEIEVNDEYNFMEYESRIIIYIQKMIYITM